MQTGDADGRVGLVDGSIGADAKIVLRAALTAAERGRAVVAGARVNPIENNHSVDPFLAVEIPSAVVNQLLPSAQTASMAMTMATN